MAALSLAPAAALAGSGGSGPRASALVTPGPTPDKATDAAKKAALADYNSAQLALNLGKLEDALAKFRASYGAVASPNSRMMLARVLMKLGRSLEAHREAQAANEEAQLLAGANPKYKTTITSTRADLDELEAKLGLVNVSLPPGALEGALSVGGVSVELEAVGTWLPANPGRVKVAFVCAAGTSEAEVEVPAGAKVSVALRAPARKVELAPEPKVVELPKELSPAEVPPPDDSTAHDRGAFVVGLKAGALVSLDGLKPNGIGAAELGYVLPFARRAFGFIVDVGYAQPVTSEVESDPRVVAGGYTWKLVQQQLTIQPSLYYRATMLPNVGPGKFVPYVAAGPRVFLTRSHTDSDGTLPALLEQREDSTEIGVGAHLGTEYLLGPGAIAVEALLGWAPIAQRTTGEAALMAVSAFGGYRFML